MWKDPIVEETRRRREELARHHNYDVMSIAEELRRQQAEREVTSVVRAPKRVKPTAA